MPIEFIFVTTSENVQEIDAHEIQWNWQKCANRLQNKI